ncbi:MAG: right-handed parallel beta-helix repeat-containing protein [Alistipes sp.]|nr:right-handed parallel beta-helix repeat-containing protein [Alistipes sp.]
MKLGLTAIFASLSLLASAAPAHRDTVRISEFGLRPYSHTDAASAIREALETCRKVNARVLLFDEGRYDIWPEGSQRREWFISNTSSESECPSKVKTVGVLIENMHGLTIDGRGAELIFHGSMITFGITGSSGITLKNLRTDFARPAMTEFRIVARDSTGTTVEFHPDSTFDIDREGRIRLFGEGWQTTSFYCTSLHPVTGLCEFTKVWDTLMRSRAEYAGPHRVKFATPDGFNPDTDPVYVVRDYVRDHVGMFIAKSSDVVLEEMEINYMNGIGIVGQFTRNIALRHVECRPHEGSGRVMAASADFSHFSGCSGKIEVTDCRFSGAQDDPINVHGTNLRIVERKAKNRLVLRFMHAQSYGFDAFSPRDSVAFVTAATMERRSTAVVKRVRKLSQREVEVTFDRAVPDDITLNDDCVENLTCTPEVEIRRCHFTHTHTRGTLVTTPRRVVIADNCYVGTGMSAILIEGDAQGWYESGPVCDVTIENNDFIFCGYGGGPANAVIALHPSNRIIDSAHPVHRNVRIRNNRFLTFGNTLLYAKSTAGLSFENNVAERFVPEEGNPRDELLARKSVSARPFVLEGCSDVSIENNVIEGYNL